jgi:glutamate-1-semialdehyde 2,1-aminomutase
MRSERPNSKKIYEELCQVIPGGVNSPVRSCRQMDQLPMVVAYGKEDLLFDEDGHSYIDYCCSWGALIHGHAHSKIVKAVQSRVEKGSSFGITSKVEEELAREVVHLIDSIEKIRFVSSGTEATMSAARLARGYTGRDLIVKFSGHYHGHADFFLVEAGSGVFGLTPSSSSAGIPSEIVKQTVCLPFNNIKIMEEFFLEKGSHVAAVILEPIAANMGLVPAEPEFLAYLREATKKIGALLIFDEVITGFRIGLHGAQGYFGIDPDLTCFGKIIGGGFPAAAFGGKAEIMDCLAPLGKVYQAGTLSGNPVAMEAGLQSLKLLKEPGFYQGLQLKADLLTKPLKQAIDEMGLNACIQQQGSLFTLFFGKRSVHHMEDVKEIDMEKYGRFFRYLFERGIYAPPSPHEAWFVSNAHKEENLIRTRGVILSFLSQ